MTKLRAGQIWTDVHPRRKRRVIQIRVVGSDFVVVTSSNNRTTRIDRRSFSDHPRCRKRFEYITHQPQPKIDWDSGPQVTAAQLQRYAPQENQNV